MLRRIKEGQAPGISFTCRAEESEASLVICGAAELLVARRAGLLHGQEVDVEEPEGADEGGDDDDEDEDDDLQEADPLQFLQFLLMTTMPWCWLTVHFSLS